MIINLGLNKLLSPFKTIKSIQNLYKSNFSTSVIHKMSVVFNSSRLQSKTVLITGASG